MSEATEMNSKMQIPLSFPVFYQSVIKQRLTLKQYDAVNLLLLGKRYSDCVEMQISQSTAANYVSGKKKISKDIITQLLECTPAECKRRLQALGLQNLDQGIFCLKYMLYNGELQINGYDRARLLHLVRNDNDFYNFLTEVFILAVKCPPKDMRPLTDVEETALTAYQDPLIIGDVDADLTPEQIAESEKMLVYAEAPTEDMNAPILRNRADIYKSFSTAIHRTRLITLPQDYSIVLRFFYDLTGETENYTRDCWIADKVRPYYEHAYLHIITIEAWCVLAGAYNFHKVLPSDEHTSLCVLVEGSASAQNVLSADSFQKDDNFTGADILYRLDDSMDNSHLRMSWVFLTGDTR